MDLLTLLTNYEQDTGNVPEMPVENLIAETVPTEGKAIFQSRPGLVVERTYGTDPIRAVYSEPNIFNEDTFVVAGNTLYREGTSLGTINGTGVVSFAGFINCLYIAAGSSLWKYNGTTLTAVTLPDSFSVLKVLVAASRLVLIKKDTQTFYWSDTLSDTVAALSFAEAENFPDRILDMILLGDTIIFFGQGTVEFWIISGADPDLPFVPVVGRVFSKGISHTGSVARLISSDSFAWITDTHQICLNKPSTVISNGNLEKQLASSTNPKLWTFILYETEYLAVTTDTDTWVFQPSENGLWTKFSTYGITGWEAGCYSNNVFGSKLTGRTLRWSDEYVDEGYASLVRLFRVWQPLSPQSILVNNVTVGMNTGTTPHLTGAFADPLMEMRASRDGGNTWSTWIAASTGAQGAYRKYVRWLSCGIFSYPGLMMEFRCSSPTPLRVSNVYVNEPYGGF